METYYRIPEVAARCGGVDRNRVYDWIDKGVTVRGFAGGRVVLKATQLPSGLRVAESDLKRFMHELQAARELATGHGTSKKTRRTVRRLMAELRQEPRRDAHSLESLTDDERRAVRRAEREAKRAGAGPVRIKTVQVRLAPIGWTLGQKVGQKVGADAERVAVRDHTGAMERRACSDAGARG